MKLSFDWILAPTNAIATTVPEKIVTNINNNPEDRVANQPSQQENHQQIATNCEFTSFVWCFDSKTQCQALTIRMPQQMWHRSKNSVSIVFQCSQFQSDCDYGAKFQSSQFKSSNWIALKRDNCLVCVCVCLFLHIHLLWNTIVCWSKPSKFACQNNAL